MKSASRSSRACQYDAQPSFMIWRREHRIEVERLLANREEDVALPALPAPARTAR